MPARTQASNRTSTSSRLVAREIPFSLAFDGVTNKFGKVTAAPFANATKVTILGWIKMGTATTTQVQLETTTLYTAVNGFALSSGVDFLSFAINDATNARASSATSTKMRAGRWYRFCITIDETIVTLQCQIFLNGVASVASRSDGNCIAGIATNDLYIGERAGTTFPFGGNLIVDHVITGKAFTGPEALSEYLTGRIPSGGAALLTYAMNEGEGTTIADSSGNGKNIALTSPTWSMDSPMVTRRVRRSVPYSLLFAGTTQYGSAAAVPFANATKVTILGWVKVQASSAVQIFMETSADYNTANAFAVYIPANTRQISFSVHQNAVGYQTVTTNDLQPGWHRFCLTMDQTLGSNEVNIYIDGVLNVGGGRGNNDNLSAGIATNTLYVGMRNGASFPFAGNLILNRVITAKAFTAAEALTDYTTGVLASGGTNLLVYAWNEGNGATITDSSGNGKNITLVNTPSWSTDRPS